MKTLIVYVYKELFEEELTDDNWVLVKHNPDHFNDDLRQEFISYWRNRLNQEPSYRGISLVLMGLQADGSVTTELLYREVQPPKKKVIINPAATEKNKRTVGNYRVQASNSPPSIAGWAPLFTTMSTEPVDIGD